MPTYVMACVSAARQDVRYNVGQNVRGIINLCLARYILINYTKDLQLNKNNPSAETHCVFSKALDLAFQTTIRHSQRVRA